MIVKVIWIIVCVIFVKAEDMYTRRFEKRKYILDRNTNLFNSNVNASSRLKCASLCSEQKCDCMSYVYNETTRICSMTSIEIQSNYMGNDEAYVDKPDCCSVPYVRNAYGIVHYTSSGTAFNYICDPDLYIAAGDPAMSCSWVTGQWSTVQFQCHAPSVMAPVPVIDPNSTSSWACTAWIKEASSAVLHCTFFSVAIIMSSARIQVRVREKLRDIQNNLQTLESSLS